MTHVMASGRENMAVDVGDCCPAGSWTHCGTWDSISGTGWDFAVDHPRDDDAELASAHKGISNMERERFFPL